MNAVLIIYDRSRRQSADLSRERGRFHLGRPGCSPQGGGIWFSPVAHQYTIVTYSWAIFRVPTQTPSLVHFRAVPHRRRTGNQTLWDERAAFPPPL